MAKVETSVTELKLNKLTKEQYNSIAEPSNTELYFVTDEPISYNDLSDKPNLKPVATSGSYDSLTEKPVVNGIEIDSTNKTNYGISTTAAATVEKEVSIPSITQLKEGQVIIVQPTITSTAANSTLKLNDFPAYLMWYNKKAIANGTSTASSSATATGYSSNVWNSNFPTIWMFDGEHWVFLSHGTDFNTTYTINYGVDAGQYISGNGAYAISRYSLIMQKPDMTWEKITDTSVNYSTGTTKTVNTSGFLLNQIKYYNSTTNCANGAKIGSNTCYVKHSGIDLRYSTNCGSPTTWPNGSYIYLVGAINPSDGLFYLDTTQWWSNSLPNSNDGKLYIRLGIVITANSYSCSFLEDRPVFYHDGTKLCEYKVADNKQDKLISGTNLKTINNISLLDSGDIATNDLLPSQAGNTGKFLTTDGTDISWADVDAFPDQTDNAGKYLTTNGTTTFWDDITIEQLTTSAQQNALNSNITSSLVTQITTNQNDISEIQGKIPSAATTTNQLADKAFVNSTVTTLLARYITSSASGDSFATNAALVAGPYYLDGTTITTANLNNNDYAMVMEDETHDNKPARYIWSGTQWSFQYVLNNTTFTQAQVDAMNSTITVNKVADYDAYATTKQNVITGGASTITSNNLTASRALTSNGSGKVAVSTTTSTELGYVHGVTSAIQTQLDDKVAKLSNAAIVYGTNYEGAQIYLNYTPNNTAWTIAQRDSDGNIKVSLTPTDNAHVTSKKYVDDNLALKASISSLATVATSGSYNDLSNKLIDGTGITIGEDNSVNIIQLDKTYTEIGSLTQSSEGVYSGFGPNAYVRLALGFTDDFSNGSGIFRVKTGNNLAGIQPILCDTATIQHVIGMVNGVPTFYNVENVVQLSATPLSTNTWYWFAITADENGDIYYSCIVDNDYTIETLPPFSQWTIYTFMLHDDFLAVLANTSLQVGKDFWNHVWLGEVDLKDSIAIVDNVPVWGYVDLGTVPAKASVDKFGLVRPDDTTITINDGIISYKNTNGYWTGNDVQNYRDKYITNCVTELPNDIKLEYSNDVLTIKGGSKLYYPNGANVFEEVVLENDETCTLTGTSTYYIFRRNAPGTTGYFAARIDQISSGASISSSTNGLFYDTTANRIDWYEGGNRGDRLYSFPICKISISSGVITSIDRIFNGIGYIGSIVYATPGITVLIPNGRNEDNTLINIEKTTTSISTYTAFDVDYLISHNGTIQECYNNKYIESEVFPADMNAGFWYNIRENKLYRIQNYALDHQEKLAVCCHITTDNTGKAINIDYKYPFRGTDYYDFKNLESKVNINDSNVVHKTGTETIAGTKTFTYYAKLASGTIFTKQGGQPSIEGGEFHFEKGDSDTTIYDYVVEDLYGGKVRFFGTCNKDGGGTEVRHPLAVNFTNNRIDTPSVYINGILQNDTGTTSKLVPTIGWVNDTTSGVNNIVHKTGEEVIAGTKRFTDLVGLKNISYSLFDNIASSKYLYYNDKDGHVTGWVESRINNGSVAGESRLRLFAETYTDNTFTTGITACVDVIANPDGTIYATAPTPSSATDDSIKIATTHWVNLYMSNAVDGITIVKNASNKLEIIGTKNKNTETGATSTIYDWVGTLAEYKTQNVAITHPDWVCYITDDVEGGESVYTKTEQDVMLAEKADVDLSNSTRLTNCILDIPQDVKITLSADKKTAYVEAGSVMYYADGFEQDGTTKKFTKIILNSRRAIGIDPITAGTAPGYFPIVFRYTQSSGNGVFWANVPFDYCVSGSTNPGNGYEWYDTTNNIEGYTTNGGISDRSTFPIGMLYRDEDDNLTIAQIYNGFGYIGSTVYAVPGIKYLMPDGLQTGGQLKTIENTTSVLSVVSNPDTADATQVLFLDSSGLIQRANVWISSTTKPVFTENYTQLWFNPDTNLVYRYRDSSTQSYINACLVGRFTHNDSTKITDFSTRNAFIAADYNELDGFVEDKILELGYRPTLFAHEWDDKLRNDVQWLRGDTFSWQDGKVYKAAYKHLYDEWASGYTIKTDVVAGHTLSYRLAADGHKIVPAAYESVVAAIYEDTGIAWYYIIDTINQRFKLPRDNHAANRVLIKTLDLGAGWARIYSDGWVEQGQNNVSLDTNGQAFTMPIPMTNSTYNLQLTGVSGTNKTSTSVGVFVSSYTRTTTGFTLYSGDDNTFNACYFSWKVCGYGNTNYLKNISTQFTAEHKYLYFYVGKYTQSALLNTAGMKTETVNDKADRNLLNSVPTAQFAQLLLDAGIDTVIESQLPTAENNYTWYRKYKSGWVEQGGRANLGATVTFPVIMATTDYTLVITSNAGDTGTQSIGTSSLTTTSFYANRYTGGSNLYSWQISGMAA